MDPRENKIDYIEFPAGGKALAAAKAFYSNVFGWTYQEWGPDYCDTKSSGVSSGLNADKSHAPKAPLPVIFVSNLETVREKVVSAGGNITRDIFPFPGGRRFHYADPAGNELAVWSDTGTTH